MSRAMSIKELGDLLKHIKEAHSFCQAAEGQRHVKYVDPHIDTRTWECFSVTFRCGGDVGYHIHTQNECRDLEMSLYERCMAWLDGQSGPAIFGRALP